MSGRMADRAGLRAVRKLLVPGAGLILVCRATGADGYINSGSDCDVFCF